MATSPARQPEERESPPAPIEAAEPPPSRFSGAPLRLWLVAALLVTIGVTGITSTLVGVTLIGKGIFEQAQDKARLDLNSARLVYQDRLDQVRSKLRLASLRRPLITALSEARLDEARAQALSIKTDGGFDYVDIADPSGRVLARSERALAAEEPRIDSVLGAQIVAGRPDTVSAFARSSAELARESPELAERARIVLRTPVGPEQPPREIGTGLVIEGAAAVRNDAGDLVAILYGGVLLNHDARTVDQIRNTIYEGEAFNGKPTGGATLCLGDVRVATNMLLRSGERAVGTTVDPVVRDRVLRGNQVHVDRANVLGEVYFSAYEPIRDPDGQPIGILSLGIPEQRYAGLRNEAFALFVGIVLLGAAAAVVLATRIGRLIVRPVQGLVEVMREYEHGQLDRRVASYSGTPSEIAELGRGFNDMADALRERELQLRYRTEEQLGKAERLAMIGRLSAGVAHEINNPLGGILLFASLLMKKTPPDGPERAGLERICNEAKRCQQIVQGLLDFARPRAPKLDVTVLEIVLDRALQLVSGQSLFHNIVIKKDYAKPEPRALVDAAQLQQVLLNLIVNAAEAMEGRGELALVTRPVENGRSVQIEIADTGCGISQENLEKLFEPFFTTKEGGRGTGLGLSISRGIVETHHGTIWAESKVGKGTRFYVRLPTPESSPLNANAHATSVVVPKAESKPS